MLRQVLVLIAHLATAATVFGGDAPAPEVVLAGQVVCSGCWDEADRALVAYGTAADLQCARKCAEEGIPAALAVREGGAFVLVVLAPGSARIDRQGWLDRTGRFFEVLGERRAVGDREEIRVSAAVPLAERPEGFPVGERIDAPALGTPAPALELPDLRGVRQSLAALHGRIVVLNFWATWCRPCIEEMPALARLQRDFGAWGVQVVAAAADDPAASERVGDFARKQRMSFPVWLGASTESMRGFGLPEVLPGTVVIDERGRIAVRFPGTFDPKALRDAVAALQDGAESLSAAPGGGEALAAAASVGKPAPRGSRVPT